MLLPRLDSPSCSALEAAACTSMISTAPRNDGHARACAASSLPSSAAAATAAGGGGVITTPVSAGGGGGLCGGIDGDVDDLLGGRQGSAATATVSGSSSSRSSSRSRSSSSSKSRADREDDGEEENRFVDGFVAGTGVGARFKTSVSRKSGEGDLSSPVAVSRGQDDGVSHGGVCTGGVVGCGGIHLHCFRLLRMNRHGTIPQQSSQGWRRRVERGRGRTRGSHFSFGRRKLVAFRPWTDQSHFFRTATRPLTNQSRFELRPIVAKEWKKILPQESNHYPSPFP